MISPMSNRILVIEDEDRIRQFLQRGLAYESYRVDVAADGPTGLALARENPPDIVILDLSLYKHLGQPIAGIFDPVGIVVAVVMVVGGVALCAFGLTRRDIGR